MTALQEEGVVEKRGNTFKLSDRAQARVEEGEQKEGREEEEEEPEMGEGEHGDESVMSLEEVLNSAEQAFRASVHADEVEAELEGEQHEMKATPINHLDFEQAGMEDEDEEE
jgi:hypothetical protein